MSVGPFVADGNGVEVAVAVAVAVGGRMRVAVLVGPVVGVEVDVTRATRMGVGTSPTVSEFGVGVRLARGDVGVMGAAAKSVPLGRVENANKPSRHTTSSAIEAAATSLRRGALSIAAAIGIRAGLTDATGISGCASDSVSGSGRR